MTAEVNDVEAAIPRVALRTTAVHPIAVVDSADQTEANIDQMQPVPGWETSRYSEMLRAFGAVIFWPWRRSAPVQVAVQHACRFGFLLVFGVVLNLIGLMVWSMCLYLAPLWITHVIPDPLAIASAALFMLWPFALVDQMRGNNETLKQGLIKAFHAWWTLATPFALSSSLLAACLQNRVPWTVLVCLCLALVAFTVFWAAVLLPHLLRTI